MSEISGEGGFEVGRGYIAVSPDASDFAAALDEQIGGLSVAVMVTPDASDFASAFDEQIGGLSASVAVTPDTSDFASAVDEQTGGLTASVTLLVDPEGASDFGDMVSEQGGTVTVPVTVVPDVTDFADMLGEEAGGTTVPVTVVPDVSDFDERLNEEVGTPVVNVMVMPAGVGDLAEHLGGVGALPVTVTPDVSDFAQQLDEETGGLTVDAAVVPDVAGLQGAIDDQTGDLTATLTVDADTTQAVAAIQELEAEAADDSGIQTLYNGILSIGPAATQAEMEAVDALDGIRAAASTAVPADAITEPFAAIGAAAESAASEVTSALGEADSGIETFLSGIYRIGPAADAAASQVADDMGNARQAIADLASAAGSVDYSAATAGLSNVDGAATSLAEDAPAAADASKGLSGVLEELAGRMSYFAVDPFMWMYAAPVVIEGVSAAVQSLSETTQDAVTSLAKADDISAYSVTGYQHLSTQLADTSAQVAKLGSTQEAVIADGTRFGASMDVAAVAGQGLSQQAQQAATDAQNLGSNLGILQAQYGLSAAQASQLAQAAGVSGQQLQGSGAAADAAMAKIEAYANANLSATGPVGQLAADAQTFGNDALTASAQVSALNDSYNLLVGRFVAGQQAQLTVAQDFLNIEAGAATAGASMTGVNQQSLALQQAFYATIPAVEQTADAMKNEGDSAAQVTSYVQDQIDKLSGLTGGSQQASQAVQSLTQFDDNLRSSVDATSQAILTSAGNLQNSFIKQLEDAGAKSATTKTDVDELTDSILATGTQSTATESARAQLIKDLENAGISAQAATKLVDTFIKSIQNIPSSKTVSIIETATGTITINEATQTATTSGTTATLHGATGGLVYGGSGHPKADDIHAMLSHGEYVVQAPAVHKYGSDLLDSINHMHFAEGGYAGDLSGLGAWTGNQYQSLQSGFTAQMEALLATAIGAKAPPGSSTGGPVVNLIFNGTQMPTPEQTHALMTQLSAAVGVS
jgi:hypothetical protein